MGVPESFNWCIMKFIYSYSFILIDSFMTLRAYAQQVDLLVSPIVRLGCYGPNNLSPEGVVRYTLTPLLTYKQRTAANPTCSLRTNL